MHALTEKKKKIGFLFNFFYFIKIVTKVARGRMILNRYIMYCILQSFYIIIFF